MKVAPQFRKFVESEYNNLDVNLQDIDIEPPTLDSSQSTRLELEELDRLIAESRLPPTVMRVADRDPLKLFYSVAKKKGLDPLEIEAKEWADDWTKLSFELKFKFKRRRPYEVKREHDIDFVVNKSDTTDSPSYPSGHAMMGYGVAEFYKDKYPLMSDEWDNIADIIAHSRLQMGVHYPSDVEASKRVVAQLVARGVKTAGIPRLNSILKATESGLAKLRMSDAAEAVNLFRARRNLGAAVQDLRKYQEHTGRLGQMPRMVIPKTHLNIKDLKQLGFKDSLVAVPEVGQATWTTYRHPIHNIHLHDHGKFLNMHVDSLPSLQMVAERNALSRKARENLLDTIPEGVRAWVPTARHQRTLKSGVIDQLSGMGHALLEGVPGYVNYGLKQLNPYKIPMVEEILSKLPKDYLKKRYGITKVSSEVEKVAAPIPGQDLLKKVLMGSSRGGFLTSGDTTPPTEADPHYTDIVPPKPKRKRQELEEIVGLVRDEIAKASPEDMEYSKLVASGLPMEEIVARELIDPFTSRDNWSLTPEEYKQFRYSVIKDKKKLYPVARPYALAERYGIDLGLPEDVAQRNARMHPAFANFSYPSFHTARGAFLAETARDLVPEDKQHLVDDLIARIGRSRIQQGVHSHQDVEAGEAMGREAAKRYKELGIKTSAYKDYRPRGTLYLLDGKGGVMADKPTESYGSIAPYHFPGGGIFEEEKVDRLPTSSEIAEGIEREALEELGTKLKNVRILQDNPVNIDMPEWWRERQRKKRGLDYKGIAEFYAAAERGDLDKSIYGADNDEFKGTFYPIDEVASAIEGSVRPGDEHYDMSMGQARLLRSLLEKTSSDNTRIRRPRVSVFMPDGKGNIFTQNHQRGFYKFPGGGVFLDDKARDRMPTDEEVLEAANQEALEELGYSLRNSRIVGDPRVVDIDDPEWQKNIKDKSGQPYTGISEHYVVAEPGEEDRSVYNIHGDAFTGDYVPIKEVIEDLEKYKGPLASTWGYPNPNASQIELLKSLLEKTSSQRLRTTIFGIDPEGKLLHGFGNQGFYKFPGGGVDPGESIVDAAKRELLEEAGYDVESIEELPGLDTSDSVGASSAKGHMGHGSSLTKYLLARLGKRNESLLGSEGDAISNLQTAPIDEVLGGLEGDMLFGSGVAESNHAALSRVRDMLQKTSSEQPLLRHRSTLLIRDPETNRLLAAKETDPSSKASPFFFPGGGLYDDEYDTPRNPSDEDVIEGARREALEELGIELDNPRVVGSYAQELEDWWKEKALKNRGVPYLGGHEHYVLADKGKEDRSMYNVEGDAFEQGDYYDPKEIVEALSRAAKSDSAFAPFNREQVRAIKDNLLKKKASDLSVLTAVPTKNLDMIMRKGLYSQKAMLDDPEVMAAFLAQRNADKAWKNDEQYDEKRFREQYDKRLELMEGDDAPLAGPSVFFTEPDPDKVSDPRHFVNKFDTQKLRVNLGKLLADIPETRITGAELIPSSAAENMSDEEFDQYVKDRRRDITPEEAAKYIATDPKELWKHYKDEYLGRYYAADVPHAFIRTPSGIIPPEYLERVEKTSEAKPKSAVIIKGNPYYLEQGPDVENYANYYKEIEDQLRKAGYGDITYDRGDDYTTPKDADLWVGHSRGAGRLRFAPEGTKTLDVTQYEDGIEEYKALLLKEMVEKGYSSMGEFPVGERPRPGSGHYTITDRMREALSKTSSAKEQLKHILVTGHSGAGKTTYARQLAEELGIPLHRLDVTTGPIMEAEYPEYWDKGTLGYPEDVSTRVIQQALNLDKPHVIEGSHILEIPELTEGYKRVLIDTPEDRVVEQRAQREYRNQGRKGKPYRPIEKHREAAQELVDHYRDIVTNFRNQPGVESIVPEVKTAQDHLKHILITGQSGSGKTTEAKRLAAELGMPVVHLDEQKGFGPKGVDPDYIEDLTEATQGIIRNLDKPHIVEGTQMLSEQFPLELLQSNDLRILEADEDELVKRLTERGWNTESGRDLKGPESADEARHVVKHQRKSVDSLVERLKKKAALEDEFKPDLTPDDLKALGVYDQVYGDAPSEASMKEWPEHWINKQDPLGWLQWYDRYSKGRRTDDDERQMKRWKSFKARHLAQYLKKPTPRRAAALRNWGIDVEKY